MTAIRQALLILAMAAVPAVVIGFFLIDTHDAGPDLTGPPAPGEVEVATARTWEKVLWVDARSTDRFEKAHIPGAVSLTEERWDDDLVRLFDAWNADMPVVVYCDSATCDISRRVAERLREEVGLENVHVLRGGWDAWRKEGP